MAPVGTPGAVLVTDYTQAVLGFVDGNWSTANYGPKPVVVDKRDGRRLDGGRRSTTIDPGAESANFVTVAPVEETTEPEGLGYEFDAVEATVQVEVHAAHVSEHGLIADASEFRALVEEVRRTLRVERVRPIAKIYRLETDRLDDRSGAYTDYYRAVLRARFVGIEALP